MNGDDNMARFSKPDPLAGFTEILPSVPVNPPADESEFVTDTWLAKQMQMAVATVRSQRWKRLHGLDHWLDLTPVYLGSRPRYRRSEAIGWLHSQIQHNTIKAC